MSRTYLVTGYPGFIGKRLAHHLSRADPDAKLFLVVQPKLLKTAKEDASALASRNVEVMTGDVVDMHLGLAGEEYARLCDEVTDVFHLAAVSQLDTSRETAARVNVDGTRNLLELARDCRRLDRFNYFSSCFVAGDRQGMIAEDELDAGQSFRNTYEETKYQAERLVQRASASLPITVYRPSSVVGDSQTGEIDRFDGPYYLGLLLVMSPLMFPLPLPENGIAPLHVVPVDFVVKATWALSRDARAVGKTFHLVDPAPLSVRRAYELIAERANRRRPSFRLPVRAAEVMLRLPWLERLARPQRAALSYVSQLAFYNCSNTLALLEDSGIRCPALPTYLDALVGFVRATLQKQREDVADVEDPLDQAPASV